MAYDRMHKHTEIQIKPTTTKMELTDHKTCNHGRELKEKQHNVSAHAHNIIECPRSTLPVDTKQTREIQRKWKQQAIPTDDEESMTPITNIIQPFKKTKKLVVEED